MSWRPEEWRTGDLLSKSPDIFEAGADAMLEALKEKGAWMTPEQMKLLAPDRKYPYGYIVFIPEERGPAISPLSDVKKNVVLRMLKGIRDKMYDDLKRLVALDAPRENYSLESLWSIARGLLGIK